MRSPPDQFTDALAHADWVSQLARTLVADADAEDLVQDTWVATLGNPGAHRGWLAGVVRNLAALKHRTTARRVRRELERVSPDAPPTADVVLERLELQRLISTLVSELPEPARTVLFLRFYEGLDATAIGARLSMPAGTVRWRLKQGLDALRAELDRRFGERQRWAVMLGPFGVPDAPSLLPGVVMKAKHVVVSAVMVVLALLGAWWWPSAAGMRGAAALTPVAVKEVERPGARLSPDVDAAARVVPAWATQAGAPARRVAGRVSRAGVPVARARVLLTLTLQPTDAPPQERWTAADGTFDFGPQLPAELSVSASAPQAPSTIVELDLRNPRSAPRPEALELTLATSCEATLVGRVLDSGAGAVPTATVREANCSPAHADARGDFELCLPRGPRTVFVEAPGYGAVRLSVSLEGRTRRDVVLAPEASLSGVVLDAATDAPVADAMVWAQPARYQNDDGARATMVLSDARGRFRLGVAPGDFKLFAMANGTARSPLQVVSAAVGTANDEVTLRVRSGVEVRGVVRSAAGPVAGAHVMAFNVANGRSVDAFSQADGRFVLVGVVPGEQVFTAAPWKVEQPKRWRAGAGVSEVTLEVVPLAALHGVVTRNHRPVEGAKVLLSLSLQEFVATSDAQGKYVLDGLPRGTFHLQVTSTTAGAFVEQPVTLAAAENRELDLELANSSSIEGVVVDARGAPVPGALVVFTNAARDDEGRGTSGLDGRFRCTQLLGGSDYTAEVFPSGKPGVPAKPLSPFPRVAVRDGDAHVEGVRLEVKVEKLSLGGRVVDAKGAPVPDVRLRAQSIEPGQRANFSPYQPLAQVFSDADGRFSFEGLSSGWWAIQARSPHGDEALVEVRAGGPDVVLTLRVAARVEGTLVDYSQTPTVYAQQPGTALVPGQVHGDTFTLTLPAGTWTLSVMDNQEGDAQRVTLSEGEVKQVVMTSRGAGKVRGHVVDHDTGLPVPDLVCHLVLAAGDKPGITNWSLESAPVTDGEGRFEQDPAPAGHVAVLCMGDWRVMSNASKLVDLARGQTVDVELEVVRRTQGARGTPGCAFEPLVPRITEVTPGGAADKAGLRVGDLVVALGGKPAGGLDASGVDLWLSNQPPGSVVEVTVVGAGPQRTVRLSL